MGITLPQAGQQATRENVIQTAQQAEKEGFDSLWVFERLLWPTNPQTPYPVTPDGSLPIEYQSVRSGTGEGKQQHVTTNEIGSYYTYADLDQEIEDTASQQPSNG